MADKYVTKQEYKAWKQEYKAWEKFYLHKTFGTTFGSQMACAQTIVKKALL